MFQMGECIRTRILKALSSCSALRHLLFCLFLFCLLLNFVVISQLPCRYHFSLISQSRYQQAALYRVACTRSGCSSTRRYQLQVLTNKTFSTTSTYDTWSGWLSLVKVCGTVSVTVMREYVGVCCTRESVHMYR
jgi:hypothetical protein